MMHIRKKHSQKAWSILGLLVLCLMASAAPAFAQDEENRIRRLENEIETLSRAVYKGETPPAGSYSSASGSNTDMEVRLQQMEADVRELRGKFEEQTFEVKQLRDQLTRQVSDIEMRLNALEGNGTGAPAGGAAGNSGGTSDNPPYPSAAEGGYDEGAAASEPGASEGNSGYQWGTNNNANSGAGQLGAYGDKAAGGSPDNAADLYENAFSLIKNNNYDQAQSEFQSFLDQYPDHALAGNAKYWLGETYYVRGKYEEAARIFAEGYQKYPKSAKSADNLLKLGLTLDALGKKADACIALKQLTKENLTGAAPVMRRAEQEMARLECGE